MTAVAHRHLARDPVMRRLIRRHGPYRLEPHGRSPYETLVRAIAHQQLNGRAAETILGRFVALFPGDDFGVREGFRHAYGRRTQPTPKALRVFGERWKPYRSVAAWYLWRAAGDARRKTK